MKGGTETQFYYLEVGTLPKWCSHTKVLILISQIERDIEISKKNLEKKLFWAKMLAIQLILYI